MNSGRAADEPRWARFVGRLLRWYKENGRALPWRTNPTPYRVWVSEVMLQQTVVGTVTRRFEPWAALFPDVAALARASEREVLAAWQGMGYYRRALNLRAAARVIVDRHDGRIPVSRKDLLALPGVGPYIASAIRSLAFGEDEAAVDANVTRIFMRLLCLNGRAHQAQVRKVVAQHARHALPAGRAADYNQALMDFGSLVCRPNAPDCDRCFAARQCRAHRSGRQGEIPPRRARRLTKVATVVAVFLDRGRVYIQRRPPKGLFAGMWEFPGGKVENGEEPREALAREVREELGVECEPRKRLSPIVHYYTQFEVTLHAFLCEPPKGLPRDSEHRWVPLSTIADYPMPSANRRLIGMLEGE